MDSAGSTPHNSTVKWVPSPQARGTWDLLYSCTFTLVLCIATALHLNVPKPGQSDRKHLLRKIKWMACGLFAPEIVLYVAISQWWVARLVRDDANTPNLSYFKGAGREDGGLDNRPIATLELENTDLEMQRIDRDSGKQSQAVTKSQELKNRTWSLVEGFFVVMGGVAFDASEFSDYHKRLLVTPTGMRLLNCLGCAPKITREAIEDKSKGDILAKGLVIFQTAWLVLQCIARKVNALPISLLEIHTMVHVVCALMMYSFWFKKPLEVRDPLDLYAEEYKGILAYMAMLTPGLGFIHEHRDAAESSWLIYEPATIRSERAPAPSNEIVMLHSRRAADEALNLSTQEPSPRAPVSLVETETNPGLQLRKNEIDSYSRFGFKDYIFPSGDVPRKMSEKDVRRWELAASAIRRYPQLKEIARFGREFFTDEDRDFVAEYLPNIQFSASAGAAGQRVQLFAVSFLAVCYGAVHMSTLNYDFPTATEGVLWYGSCLFIMTFSAVLVAWWQHPNTSTRMKKVWDPVISLGQIILIHYIAARGFIVIEAFISLRKSDADLYKTVRWADYIPHL
ncbi:predicted protein [Uncinocarpus reesii 1704]|uniref:Uncharacterized protein n=1 Tax=Uncinocarpus reesii (strain UAMH 1704) TaxID=336963 RepID=C4JQ79_UNCRE|nr:uncharacterized protein UREG_03312 [Uncinocarpus reesii 1704]EEP78466.1 predicted protein [Uncinocarpus reesii 1704]